MKVKEFLENYRGIDYNLTVEFRINNNLIRIETFNCIENISEEFKDKEIDNWFVDKTDLIVIDCKGE